jgi:hypothetical protein
LPEFTFQFVVALVRKASKQPSKNNSGEGDRYMGIFDPDEVITIYSLREAIADGAVVEVFKDEWDQLSRGKPIAATINVYEDERFEDLVRIWNDFGFWRKYVMRKLPERERLFSTEIDYRTIWVIDYKAFFMMMYPEDY